MTTREGNFVETNEEAVALGARLREAREYVGFKQEQAAGHLGVRRSAISDIENGKRGVSALELAKLARLYGRPARWFTGEEEPAMPADVAFLARAAADMSDNDRRELRRFAEFLRDKSSG